MRREPPQSGTPVRNARVAAVLIGAIVIAGAAALAAVWLTPGGCRLSYKSWPGYEHMMGFLVDDCIWQPGGPHTDPIADYYRRAAQAGSFHTLGVMEASVARLRREGRIVPEPFRPTVEVLAGELNPDATSVRRNLEESLRHLDLPREIRLERARALLTEGSGSDRRAWQGSQEDDPLSVAWGALSGGLDEVAPLVAPAVGERLEKVPDLKYAMLPLASARLSSNYVDAHLALVREALAALRGLPFKGLSPELLLQRALLDLVWEGKTGALTDLKSIYQEEKRSSGFIAGYPTSCPARSTCPAMYLIRAIRCLGDSEFEADLWQRWYPNSPAAVEQTLVEEGILAR